MHRSALPILPARPSASATPRGGAPRGFTLVEVLVALLIMAVIAAMGWQGVSAMSRAREHTGAATERALRLSSVVGQWEQDLQAVLDSARTPGLHFDGAALRMVRRAEDATHSGAQVVVWSVREGVWRRWAGPVLDRQSALAQSWETALQLSGNEPGQVRLLDGVTGWQLYYFRDQAWTNAQSSGDLVAVAPRRASDPGNNQPRTALPAGVRLQIDLPEGRLLRDVAMAPQMP